MKLTDEAIDKIMADADLELAEPYNSRGSYRKGDWLLTRCRRCGVVAHYRLAYILEKTELGEPVCRACFWPGWYDDCHKTRAEVIQKHLDEGVRPRLSFGLRVRASAPCARVAAGREARRRARVPPHRHDSRHP